MKEPPQNREQLIAELDSVAKWYEAVDWRLDRDDGQLQESRVAISAKRSYGQHDCPS